MGFYKMGSAALHLSSLFLSLCICWTVRTRGRWAEVENNKYLQLRELSKYWLDGTIWLRLSGPSLIPPLYHGC